MLFFAFLALWLFSLVQAYPRFFTFAFFLGMVVQVLAWIPFTAPLAYAVGWNNPNAVTATQVSITWNDGFYDLGNSKTLLLEVTNNTDKFYSRIVLDCDTPNGSITLYDESGISPNKKEIRGYKVEGRVVGITSCDTSRATKGKPNPNNQWDDRTY